MNACDTGDYFQFSNVLCLLRRTTAEKTAAEFHATLYFPQN